MEDADAAIAERVKAGDTDAYRLLVERHSRSVFRLAFRVTGNEFDAEDVVQEAFLRAYRQIGSYESRANFGTWVYRIAWNYALDLIRARKRHDEKRVDPHREDGRAAVDIVSSPEPEPDRVYYGAQVREHIDAALSALSEQERTAFLLRHCEGQSIDQIGAVLGTANSATKNAVFRAVRKLREALDPVVSSYHATRNG
jgi:RNA polymerase sigma-70 factor (ECF subfamily)